MGYDFKTMILRKGWVAVLTGMLLSACGGAGSDVSSSASSTTAGAKQQVTRHLQRGQKAVASDYADLVQELYIAYFGRPADPNGLNNFAAQLAAADAPADVPGLAAAYSGTPAIAAVVDAMGTSAESAKLYGTGNTSAFVTAVFQNIVGRAPTAAGLAFWQSAIDSGKLTRANAAISIMAGAMQNTSAQGLADAQLIANRLAAAESFTSGLSGLAAGTDYSGSGAAALARAMLASVDSATVVATYQSQVNATIAAITAQSANTTAGTVADTPAKVQASTTTVVLASPAYFVSPSGNDANPGTQAAPWRTLGYATNKLHPGDTLYAMGGTYAESVLVWVSGTAAAPITIMAYPGQSPVIDAATLNVANYSSLLTLSGNYLHVFGFELRNINLDGHGGQGGAAVVVGGYGASLNGTHDTVGNLLVHQTWEQGIMASGDYSTIQDSTVHMVALSNCRTPGAANCSTAARNWPSCVSVGRPYGSGLITHFAVMQRNTVYDCWGEGMSAWLSDQVTIQDNVIYNNWAENLYVNNITSSLIQRNLVYNTPNNYVGARSGFALADEVTSTTNNPLSSYNRVINNLVYNAQFCAFCWTNVPWSGLSHVLIANNTIVNPAGTLSFQTGAQSNLVPVVNSFSTIVNNIVVGNGAVPSAAGLSLSNNLWSTKPSPAALGAGDIIGDPKLTASGSTAAGQLTAAYFTLQSTSPAIGTGLRLVQVTADFTGAASSLPDIGAY